MEVKNLVLKAIERIATDNGEKPIDISVEMMNVIDNSMYFGVYGKNRKVYLTTKKKALWRMADVFELNALTIMSFNAFMKSKPSSIEESFLAICKKYDFSPTKTVVQFRKEAIGEGNLIFANEDKNKAVPYEELKI